MKVANMTEQVYSISKISAKANRRMARSSGIEKTIGIGKSQTIELINQLRFMNLVAQIGRGPSTAYVTTDLKS